MSLCKLMLSLLFTFVFVSIIIQYNLTTNCNSNKEGLFNNTRENMETDKHIGLILDGNNVLKPPNIVFMMADDLGYGDVGYNGGNAFTPNLDAMASGPNTIHLTRYYSGGPTFSPMRGTVLTGRNHNRYCIWNANAGSVFKDDFVIPVKMPLPTSEITVANILKEHGYQTAIFGKWHLGDLKKQSRSNKRWPVSHPGMHGFDEWLVTLRSTPSVDMNCGCFDNDVAKCQRGHYTDDPPCSNYYSIKDVNKGLEGLQHPVKGDDSHFILEQFKDYLKQATESGKPFFIYLPFHTVHKRYISLSEYSKSYTAMQYSKNQIDYYGAITAMDDAIGQVRSLLRKYNVSNNTMLWFTSDNGPAGGTPGVTAGYRGRKTSLYEGGIRVPGLIEWPNVISKNLKSDYPVVSSDLLPTVCDILGTSPPTDRPIDGETILPFIKGEKKTRNSTIKWAFLIPNDFSKGSYQGAISGDQYKVYTMYEDGNMADTQLSDLLNDPFEQNDLADNMPDLLDNMKMELEQWRLSVEKSAKEEVKCYGISNGAFQ